MSKKIWIPGIYLSVSLFFSIIGPALTLWVSYELNDVVDYGSGMFGLTYAIGAIFQLIVPIFMWIVLRSLLHEYKPLLLLYISSIIVNVSTVVVGFYFTVINLSTFSMVIGSISMIGIVVGFVVYILLLRQTNLTQSMKTTVTALIGVSLINYGSKLLIYFLLNLGVFHDASTINSAINILDSTLSIGAIVLFAVFYYVILEKEEKDVNYTKTAQ